MNGSAAEDVRRAELQFHRKSQLRKAENDGALTQKPTAPSGGPSPL
jgi:hypothetical protein